MTVVARRRTAATDFPVLRADRTLPARLVHSSTSLPGSYGRLPVQNEDFSPQVFLVFRDGHKRSHVIG